MQLILEIWRYIVEFAWVITSLDCICFWCCQGRSRRQWPLQFPLHLKVILLSGTIWHRAGYPMNLGIQGRGGHTTCNTVPLQSTPVISHQSGAKIPLGRVKWFSRYLKLSREGPNSWLAGSQSHTVMSVPLKPKHYVERYPYISRSSADINIAPAVAAYIRLASRSQAKFHNKRNWVRFRLPSAATPAQSTASANLSLRFSPRPWTVVNLHALSQCPSQATFEARYKVSWWLLTLLASWSQEWTFFDVSFAIKRLLFRLAWKVARLLSTKQDGGTAAQVPGLLPLQTS